MKNIRIKKVKKMSKEEFLEELKKINAMTEVTRTPIFVASEDF